MANTTFHVIKNELLLFNTMRAIFSAIWWQEEATFWWDCYACFVWDQQLNLYGYIIETTVHW